jgi:U3 small nucleolar RNA-associated protein 13
MTSSGEKVTYKPKHKLEVFYTGGAVRLTNDGKLAVCGCNDELKVRWF